MMMLSTSWRTRLPIVLATAIAVCAVATAFTAVERHIPVGYDEWFSLARYERAAAYGDFSDTVALADYANHTARSKSPESASPFRAPLHYLTGLGASWSRTISVVQFTILAGGVAWALRCTGASWAFSLLGGAFFLSTPAVLQFSRTVRGEQDVVFFGLGSILLLIVDGTSPRTRLALRTASGFLAGAAACRHPQGMIFPATALIGLVLVTWMLKRSPTWRRELAVWVVACAVVPVSTVIYYASDWENTTAFFQASRQFQGEYTARRTLWFRHYYPLPAWFPIQAGAAANVFRWGLAPLAGGNVGATADRMRSIWLLVFLSGIVVTTAWLVRDWVVRLRNRRSHAESDSPPNEPSRRRLAYFGAFAVIAGIVATAYPPNIDYAIYLNAAAALALFMVGAHICSAGSRTAVRGACVGLLSALTLLNLHYATTTIAERRSEPQVTAAEQITALRETSELLGLEPRSTTRPPIYVDWTTWAASGARGLPLFEHLIFECVPARTDYDGVVINARWFDDFTTSVDTATGAPIDVARRKQKTADLLQDLHLAAVITGGTTDVFYWFTRSSHDSLHFGRFTAACPIERDAATETARQSIQVPAGETQVTIKANLAPGRYAVMLLSDDLGNARIDTVVAGRIEDRYFAGEFQSMRYGPITLLTCGNDSTAQERSLQISSKNGGQAVLVYYRLENVVATDRREHVAAGNRNEVRK